MKARATYDPEADAIGVYFAPESAVYEASQEVAPGLTLDFDADGRVSGLEIAGVRAFLASREIAGHTESQSAAE